MGVGAKRTARGAGRGATAYTAAMDALDDDEQRWRRCWWKEDKQSADRDYVGRQVVPC